MDPRIDKIIDRLLDDCLLNKVQETNADLNYKELSEKDLLNLTQIFLEFKYSKLTRTSIRDADGKEPNLDY